MSFKLDKPAKSNHVIWLNAFIAAPSPELLHLARKTDLLDMDSHYELTSVKSAMLKHEIKNILIQFLVDEDFFYSSTLSNILVTQTDLQMWVLEIKRQTEMEFRKNYGSKMKKK